MKKRWIRAARLAVLALVLIARPALAQTGTVVGRVTNALTGAPITTVQLTVTGTRIAATVDRDGRFRLTNVPVSAREVVARGLDYKPSAVAFSLSPNETATVAISMTVSPFELDAIVVTGSAGDLRMRAAGHGVTRVNASQIVDRSTVANLAEILQARTPGLAIMPGGGSVGTASNYRLRGAGSLFASNSPTIYVDGVRVNSRSQGNYNASGQATSALDAINPADIESIEVIKGPAAATLYGAEAAAGVIQIFTKKGRPGRIKWESRFEMGRSDWAEDTRPVNYAIADAARLADTLTWPGFKGKSIGDMLSFRAMSDGRALRTAGHHRLVLSASGGAERYSFFVSAGKSDEEGVYFNNFSKLKSLRGNFTFLATNKLTLTTNVALSSNHVRLPLNDNANVGLISSSNQAEPGRQYPYPGGRNYLGITPEVANRYDNQTWAERYTIGASADYEPVSWFRNKFRFGLDTNVGRAELYFPPDPRDPYPIRYSLELNSAKGFIAQGRPLNNDVTLNYDATVTRSLSDRVVSTTSVGVQYLANRFRRTDAIGLDLGSAGVRSIGSAAITSSRDSSSEQKSIGFYAQQQLALNDRLFVTLATRMDNNSAFGSKLSRVFYPKASVSYVISEEPYFTVPWVSSLRLRAAWGQAGNAPGPFVGERSYNSSVVTYSTGTSSALRYGSLGNPDLRPERGSEIEAGFDGAFLAGRLGLDVSYYHKTTRDALVELDVPPSTGFSGKQLTNLGKISNAGIELLLTATPVQRKSLTIDATLSLATNSNKLVSFGDNRDPILLSSTLPQRFQEGYALGGMWAQQVRYNADGSLLKVNGQPVLDTTVYLGPSVPPREIALSGAVLLFGRLRLYGLFDYKGGHYQYNAEDLRRDQAGVSWQTVNAAADPDEVGVRKSQFITALHIQPADFLKLRDLSISYDLPQRFLYNVAQRATLIIAGHNLKTWTKYGGADPELNAFGVSTFNRQDLWTVPQTRRFSTSVALTF